MVSMTALLLPVVISAVLVFIASALFWMVAPHHKGDWKGLPGEDAARTALQRTPPGQYMIPFAGSQQARTEPGFVKKLAEGPIVFLTVARGARTGMGPMMIQSLIYYLIVSSIVSYVAGRTLTTGADYLQVFRVTGTVAWLGYGFGTVADSIWFACPWSSTFKQIFDALIYGLLTGGAFGWLWPR